MLVWLSWQSSSLVMSRSPVRIRPQAPKRKVAFGRLFLFVELVRIRSRIPPCGGNPATHSKGNTLTGVAFFAALTRIRYKLPAGDSGTSFSGIRTITRTAAPLNARNFFCKTYVSGCHLLRFCCGHTFILLYEPLRISASCRACKAGAYPEKRQKSRAME